MQHTSRTAYGGKKNISKTAQAMPSLVMAADPLSNEEEDHIGYHEMLAGARHYICGPNEEDELVFSHLFVNVEMVKDAGAWQLMVKTHALPLKKYEQEDKDYEDGK